MTRYNPNLDIINVFAYICPLFLKILSGNKILTSIKGRNSVANLQKFDTLQCQSDSMLLCIQNLVKFCSLVLKILSGNQILTSIKGRNSVANLQKMAFYNPNLDLVSVNVHKIFL